MTKIQCHYPFLICRCVRICHTLLRTLLIPESCGESVKTLLPSNTTLLLHALECYRVCVPYRVQRDCAVGGDCAQLHRAAVQRPATQLQERDHPVRGCGVQVWQSVAFL